MKLPIKHEYFVRIQQGLKETEFRDAHITFVSEATGQELRKNVINVWITEKHKLPYPLNKSEMFTDDKIIAFELGD